MDRPPSTEPVLVPAQGGAPVVLDAVVLADLVSIVLEGAPLGLVLQRIARIAAGAIPGALAVSVTVVRERVAASAGFTGALAAVLDERQYESGFGPCLHAAATGGEVVVADTSAETLYPVFAAVAARHGVGSVVAVGLAVVGPVTAALNVYRARPGGGGAVAMAATVGAARVFGAYAAVAVSNAAALDAQRATSAQLSEAMLSRAGIEQAKGVLMAQRGIGAEAAFVLMATISQRTNVKLREVAAQVLATAAGEGSTRA